MAGKQGTLTVGPFKGMRYTADPYRSTSQYAFFARNMVVADPVNGGPYVRRPSDQVIQVKSGTNTVLQWIGVFRKRSGFVTVAVQDGEIYDHTVAGGFVRRVTTANLTTASITMSATDRVFATTYNNTIVFNDGVNQPFTWDGTAGAGGLTLLTNAPTKCYGKPTVYYGKLFFIKDVASNSVDRAKIVWSEENAANTGYEASGYANVWQLEQAGQGSLYALVGTNAGLYYFRQDAIGVIHGAVTPAFSTSGVHDDVSTVVGTTCPSVLWYDGYLYFFDARGRPCRLPEGGRVEYLWAPLAGVFNGVASPTTTAWNINPPGTYTAALSSVAAYPWLEGVAFGMYTTTSPSQNPIWLYSHLTGELQCEITPQILAGGFETRILGEFYNDTDSRMVLAFGSYGSSVISKVAITPRVSSSAFFDTADDSNRVLILGPYGGISGRQVRFTSASLMVALGGTASEQTGALTLSYGADESPYANFTSVGSKSLPVTTTYERQVRQTWGFNTRLRWMTIKVDDDGGFEGWGVYQATVNGADEEMEADKP